MECWQYFALFHLLWGVLACLGLHKLFHGGLDYILKEDEEYAKKFKPFRRTDILKWNRLEMYIGATFLLPYRIVLTIIFTVICGTICKIAILGVDTRKEVSPTRRTFIRVASFLGARIIFFIWGFYYMENKVHRICDLDPTYPKDQQAQTAPIIVSNHVSFLDIFYYLTSEYFPGFLSKASVAKAPFVGTIATARQSIFVNRTDRNQKDAVLDDMKHRIDDIQAGKSYPPIVIYPEGTTSDGKSIITFKKGAFFSFAPVRIMCLEYPKGSFSPAYDNLDFIVIFLLLLCQLYNRIKIHDCGIYDPSHLNLKAEDDWVKYAGKVRNIMCKALNVEPYEVGFKEKTEYYTYSLNFKKQLRKDAKALKKAE